MNRIVSHFVASVIASSLWAAPPLAVAAEGTNSVKATGGGGRHFTAKEVFDYHQPLIFQDNFQSGQFGKWNFSDDDHYAISHENPQKLAILEAPGLRSGGKAVRFAVPRALNSFRSEISLPSEEGFHERWYAARVLVPRDWTYDPGKGADIVLQWHAIPGNWKQTYPNLAIYIQNKNWFVQQSYGTARNKPTRTRTNLDADVQRGAWVAWVLHAKWSPGGDGIVQIWKDGKSVLDLKGPNVYSDIGVEYTPYLKTGIYRPEWHLDSQRKRKDFAASTPVATTKVVFVTDVKVGSERATYADVSPSGR